MTDGLARDRGPKVNALRAAAGLLQDPDLFLGEPFQPYRGFLPPGILAKSTLFWISFQAAGRYD